MNPGHKHLHYLIYASAGFTLTLLAARVLYANNYTYIFLAWNLFLAWIPYAFSQLIAGGYLRGRWQPWLVALCWLAFFPNAAYLITDLYHLAPRRGVPLYVDLVLLFAAAWTGLLMGMVSLMNMERFVAMRWGRRGAMWAVPVCIALCAFGIYLGRYQRLNSWEIVSDPLGVASLIAERFTRPHEHLRTWAVTGLFTVLLLLVYYTLSGWRHYFVAAQPAGGRQQNVMLSEARQQSGR
jgi:uncharacterized membrane protein